MLWCTSTVVSRSLFNLFTVFYDTLSYENTEPLYKIRVVYDKNISQKGFIKLKLGPKRSYYGSKLTVFETGLIATSNFSTKSIPKIQSYGRNTLECAVNLDSSPN
ncbi:hypothetical protein BpHYR1_029612 [Brachionus plicatilis]|uniref:Uncharacterized protein n=1 Tax=Brachionus plicatilis TaxID=10195 RepID=A0A3M7R0Z0_BRAPC|nr:hypothetical protein BpHYR1_029612 [Brachionus plicatilis]